MDGWLAAFLLSFGVIFVAELGDKSQLMALTFAVRYRVVPVLVGITLATSLVHAVSVAVGHGLGAALPTRWVLLASGLAFLGFAGWTLCGDQLSEAEGERARRSSGPAVWAASGAFLLAELGDKTMLATITLATQHGWFGTWLGSTLGMVAADALAILVGRLLGRRLPDKLVRFGSAALFALFGCSLLIDAAGQFTSGRPWGLAGALLDHHVAGWVALAVGLLATAATWGAPRAAPAVPTGRGPGPYRAPARRGPGGPWVSSLFALAMLLGLAAPLLVAADVLQPIPPLANPGWVVVGAGLMLLGVTLRLAARREIRQVRRRWRTTGEAPALPTRGLHSRVRNPGLTGLVIAMAGTLLMVPTPLGVLATVLLVVAVRIRVRAAEPDFARVFGQDYADYQRRTGRFLPRITSRTDG